LKLHPKDQSWCMVFPSSKEKKAIERFGYLINNKAYLNLVQLLQTKDWLWTFLVVKANIVCFTLFFIIIEIYYWNHALASMLGFF
jgi:hypothetical protein